MSVTQVTPSVVSHTKSESADSTEGMQTAEQSLFEGTIKNHLSRPQRWLAQIDSSPERPAEFHGEVFDRLWEVPKFRDANWLTLKTSRLEAFADWIRKDMPSVTHYRHFVNEYIVEAGEQLGVNGIIPLRKFLRPLLQEPLQRPAELQDPFFNNLWSNMRVSSVEWANITAPDRKIFADWFISGMPDKVTSHQRHRISDIAKQLGLKAMEDAQRNLWMHLPPEMRRPDEFESGSLDRFWNIERIQSFNWKSVSSQFRQKFVTWLEAGLPPRQIGEHNLQHRGMQEVALALGYDDRSNMREQLLGQLDMDTAWRPLELRHSGFDQVWSQLALKSKPLDWSKLTTLKRQVFADWLQQGMPVLAGFKNAKHIKALAKTLNFPDGAKQMREQFWQHIPSDWRRPVALQDPVFDSFWANESIQGLNWAKLEYRYGSLGPSDPTPADSFAQWLHTDMPASSQINKVQAKHLLTIARELGFHNREEMEFDFKRWVSTDLGGAGFGASEHPQEFTSKAFVVLWEQPVVRDFDWSNLTNPQSREVLNLWVDANMPDLDTFPVLGSDTIHELASSLGYSNVEHMQQEWQDYLHAGSKRPLSFQGSAFDLLWADSGFRDSTNWDVLEMQLPVRLSTFVEWVNSDMPSMSAMSSAQRQHITAIAKQTGFSNTTEMRNTLNALISSNSGPPVEAYGAAFATLWSDSSFRNRIVAASLPAEQVKTFMQWLQEGVPGTRSYGHPELSPFIDLAKTLGFENVDEMRKEALKLLSDKPQWPAEFFSPAFTIIRNDSRFIKRSWVWEFVSPENIQTFAQWVNSGIPDLWKTEGVQTMNVLLDIANILGFKNVESMHDVLKQAIPAEERKSLKIKGSLFEDLSFMSTGQRQQAYSKIVESAGRYNANLTANEIESLLIDWEFGYMPSSLSNVLNISEDDWSQQVKSATDKFRHDQEQFPTHESLSNFLLSQIKYSQALQLLVEQRSSNPLSGYETDALLAAYTSGNKPEMQINAWHNTPLSVTEYDEKLQNGLDKLDLSLADFFVALKTAVQKVQTESEADLTINPQFRYAFATDPELRIDFNPNESGQFNGHIDKGGLPETASNKGDRTDSFKPNGLVDPQTNTESAHEPPNNNRGAITAIAGEPEERGSVFPVVDGHVVVGNVLLPELDLKSNTPQSLFGIPAGLQTVSEYISAPQAKVTTNQNSGSQESSSISFTPSIENEGVTIGGQLGSPGEAEKANAAMEQLLGPGWRQGLRPDYFPQPDSDAGRIPGFGEGVPPVDLESYNTGWGIPDTKIELQTEGFPEKDAELNEILNPYGVGRPQFTFPPVSDQDRLPEIPEGVQQAVIKALPELQGISYAQVSQLSTADQQQVLSRTLAYQQLAPNDKTNISLIEFLDSRQTSPTQRQQLSQLDATQTVQQSQLNTLEARTGLDSETIDLINARINAIQSTTGQINQDTQSIQQDNAERLSTSATPTTVDPVTAAFIKPNIKSNQTPPSAPQISLQSAPIPRFMVINTAKGPQLMENLSSGKTQMLPYPILADTPITRQSSDGGWRNVPDAYAIGAKNLLDTLLLQSTVKMLNGGNAVQAPGTQNAAPQAPTSLPQPAF